MQFLSSLLYIVLFIFCLSVLITIHELGHLAAAKAFNVYCNEFSIGFGPKFFSKKRKRGETYFSLRCIPFGGFVSMYGEGMELPDGVEVPPERSINGIKKWKRAIILAAGVTMNALLALTIFFCSECFFPKTGVYASTITVEKPSEENLHPIAYEAGLRDEDYIHLYSTNLNYVYGVDAETVIEYQNGDTEKVYTVIDGTTVFGFDKLQWSYYLHFCRYTLDEVGEPVISFDPEQEIIPNSSIKSASFIIQRCTDVIVDETTKEQTYVWQDCPITLNIKCTTNSKDEDVYFFESIGLSMFAEEYYNKNFGVTVKNTFVDFGEASVAIIQGFGSMFTTREGFQSAGGIIAIGVQTTEILKNYGFNSFLRIWGIISVNLAIVNLFPFPGLDGWQLLVLLVEGVAHKEIPSKVKSIMSLIGIGVLFIFMILLLFKDAFTFIF